MARTPIYTRAEVEARYPEGLVGKDFVPTHRVCVMNPHTRSHVVRADFVRLDETPTTSGVSFAYGPHTDKPLYGVLSTGLWQSFEVHGRVKATMIHYQADYIAPKDREGLVYFVSAGEKGPIKIGWTQDIVRRIAELQTANAYKLMLLGTVPGTMERETALHVRFAHLRLEAEWFRNSEEILDFLREETVGIL